MPSLFKFLCMHVWSESVHQNKKRLMTFLDSEKCTLINSHPNAYTHVYTWTHTFTASLERWSKWTRGKNKEPWKHYVNASCWWSRVYYTLALCLHSPSLVWNLCDCICVRVYECFILFVNMKWRESKMRTVPQFLFVSFMLWLSVLVINFLELRKSIVMLFHMYVCIISFIFIKKKDLRPTERHKS